MINDRRKTKIKANRAPKKITQALRSVATSRAKRDAAINAKRGISKTKNATDVQIDQEVQRQGEKAAAAKMRSEKSAKANKTQKKNTSKEGKSPAVDAVFGGRVPSKKAIEAALKGMKDAGFSVPTGHQVVMTFIPSGSSEPTMKDTMKNPRGGRSRSRK